MSDRPSLTVLITDDDPMIREVLGDVLRAEPDIQVVGVACDADEAVALVERHLPAVVLLDVRMPGGGGVRAAREIRLRSPATRILAFSAYDDPTTVQDMTDVGIDGYLVKGVANAELVAAIRDSGSARCMP